ncbi:hypothetical protein EJ08DRAFT_99335 [Tothia fuscella]|uniref:Uncharacterized protein n=1 Tax=Tothia fuscella TaxID=1048955 RepID=A0A9P4TSJ0_9PEZI|nr:hypothetical protein EJ08DRAFT_99335 [Tothia fuscella]
MRSIQMSHSNSFPSSHSQSCLFPNNAYRTPILLPLNLRIRISKKTLRPRWESIFRQVHVEGFGESFKVRFTAVICTTSPKCFREKWKAVLTPTGAMFGNFRRVSDKDGLNEFGWRGWLEKCLAELKACLSALFSFNLDIWVRMNGSMIPKCD